MSLISDVVRIVQDDEAQRLAALLDRFNPFNVLRIGHYELRHTNTLAWLLDPDGNHNLGEAFLRAMVHRLGAQQNGTALASCFETAADRTVTVRREVPLSKLRAAAPEAERLGIEYTQDDEETQTAEAGLTRASRDGSIDILLEGDGWVLAIEAKVRSSEANEQLPHYREALADYTRGDTGGLQRACFHIFLTVEGTEPSDAAWQVATWGEHVVNPLEAMLAMRPDLQPDVHRFLESYLETLRRHAGDGGTAEVLAANVAQRFAPALRGVQAALRADRGNQPLDVVAERVVRRHAALLGLLLRQLVSPQAARAEHVRMLLQEHEFTPLPGSVSYMRFAPERWRTMFPAMLGSEGRPVAFEFVNRPTAIVKLMVPDLGPDAADALAPARRELIQLIQAGGHINPFSKAFYRQRGGEPLRPRSPTAHFFSVYTRSIQLQDEHGPEAANDFVRFCLQDIKANVLQTLDALMTQAGLR